jgi:hypothetical protein
VQRSANGHFSFASPTLTTGMLNIQPTKEEQHVALERIRRANELGHAAIKHVAKVMSTSPHEAPHTVPPLKSEEVDVH